MIFFLREGINRQLQNTTLDIHLANPIFYVAGPPSMVAAMQQLLLSAGIDEDDVRSEEFFGY